MLDSTIKLYQINIPELSGYISLFISGQTVTTGIINYYVNSGAVLTGQTGNFVSIPYLNTALATQNVYNTFYYYPNSNPSGFITNSQTGIFVDTINTQTISGLKIFTNAIGGTSLYGYGGGFGTVDLMYGKLSASGIETLDWGQRQLLGNWNLGIATGLFITTGQTGSFSSSGNYYPLNSNPSGYITTGQTGAFGGNGNTGQLTGAFYPRFSNPSSFIVPGQTGAFASIIALNSTGNYLFSLINASSAGVSSLNTASGALTLAGGGNISIYTAGQTITISGSTGSFITTGMTGVFATNTLLNLTGTILQNNINILTVWTGSSTGLYYPYHANPSGYITTGQTGAFGGGGSTPTGNLTGVFYPLIGNPSEFILPSQTGNFVDTINNQSIGGTKIFTSSIGGTSFYDSTNEFGTVDVYNAQLNASGNIIIDWGQQQLLYSSQPVFDWRNGYIYDNNIVFGQQYSIQTNNRILYARSGNFDSNPSLDWQNQILYGIWNLGSATGSFITTGMTGSFGGGSSPTGNLTGVFYPLNNNPSGYINTGQTGVFATLAGLNASGQLLQGEVNTLNSWTGNSTGLYYPRVANPANYISHAPLAIYLTGWYNPTLGANPLFQITGTITGNNLGSNFVTIGDINSSNLQFISYNDSRNGKVDAAYLSASNVTFFSQPYPDGFFSISNGLGGFAFFGDFYGDSNNTYISVDDINGFVQLNAGVIQMSPVLADNSNNPFLNVGTKTLINTGVTTVDWKNRLLTGGVWAAQGLTVNGSPVVTSAMTGGFGGGGGTGTFSQSGSYIFSTPATSGLSQQFISFPTSLDANPYVFSTLVNTSGIENILVQTSGVSSSGYWVQYSKTIDRNGYSVNTLASLSTNTGLATTVIINNINGTTGSLTGAFYPLNSNPSGYINTGQTGVFASNISLISTGNILQGEINTINNWTGSASSFFAGTSNLAISGKSFINSGEAHFYNNAFIDTASVGYTALKLSVSGDPTLTNNNAALAVTSSGNLAFGHASYGVYVNNISVTTGSNTYAFFSLNGINYFAGPTSGTIFSGQSFISGNTNLGNYFVNTSQTGNFVDISTTQMIGGLKSFSNNVVLSSATAPGAGGGISLANMTLMDTSSNIHLNWNNNILSGTWNSQGLQVSGNPVVTSNQTGSFITTGQTGAFGAGSTPTGNLTGVFYPLNSNPSGYITSSQTGNFYPSSNPNNYSTGLYSPSVGYTNTINWNSGTTFYTTLTTNTTFTFTGYKDGQSINVSITNTGTNFFSGIWPSYIKWPYKIIPVQSSGAYTDIYTFINITGGIYGSAVQGF